MEERQGTGAKLGRVLLWIVTIVFGLAVLAAGATKFTSSASWLALFEGWGYPPAMSYLVGSVEVTAASAFFFPRFATYAASVIVVIMVGATLTLLTHPGQMGPTAPIANIIAFSLVGFLRRNERWQPR